MKCLSYYQPSAVVRLSLGLTQQPARKHMANPLDGYESLDLLLCRVLEY